MGKKIFFAILLSLFLFFLSFFIFDFQPTANPNPKQNELPPHQESLEATAEASNWPEFYRLEFTGLNLNPTHVQYDQTKKRLAIFDSQQSKLVILNLERKNFSLLDVPRPSASAITWSQGKLYLYDQAVYYYDFNQNQWEQISPTFDFQTSVKHIAKFGDNFYLFGDNLLRKVSYSKENKYLGLESWLKDEEKTSLTPDQVLVDGHIFIINPSGQISRYLRGELTNWQPKNLIFTAPSYLTSQSQGYYLLSPSHQTLFELDYQGNNIQQYQDQILQSAKFLWYDHDLNTFYTLINQNIHAFSPQL